MRVDSKITSLFLVGVMLTGPVASGHPWGFLPRLNLWPFTSGRCSVDLVKLNAENAAKTLNERSSDRLFFSQDLMGRIYGKGETAPYECLRQSSLPRSSRGFKGILITQLKRTVDKTIEAYVAKRITLEEAIAYLSSKQILEVADYVTVASIMEVSAPIPPERLHQWADRMASRARRSGTTVYDPPRPCAWSEGKGRLVDLDPSEPRNVPLLEEHLRLLAEERYHAIQKLRTELGFAFHVSYFCYSNPGVCRDTEDDVFARLAEIMGLERIPSFYAERYDRPRIRARLEAYLRARGT